MTARTFHRAGILMGAALLSIMIGSHAMAYGPAALTAKFPAETQILVRISNPQKFRNSLQSLAQNIFIPGELPTLKALEAQMNLPGGINNYAPVYFIMLPGVPGTPAPMPVMMISASDPQMVVSRLNPPAPVHGISMVVTSSGTTGYIALRRHSVLFAMHRAPLETMLHPHGSLLGNLGAPQTALLKASDLSVYVNTHEIITADYGMFQAKLRQMKQLLKATPQGITSQQKLGFNLLQVLPGMLKRNIQSMALGIDVRKGGIKTLMVLQTLKGSKASQLCAALGKMPLPAERSVSNLSPAMSIDMRAPLKQSLKSLQYFYKILGANAASTEGGGARLLQGPLQILKVLEEKPVASMISEHAILFAPVKKTDAMFAMAYSISSNHAHALAAAEIKANINSLIAENQAPAAPLRYVATPITKQLVDGIEFYTASVHWRIEAGVMPVAEQKIAVPLIKSALTAVYGGSTVQFMTGAYHGYMLGILNATPAQTLAYIAYLKQQKGGAYGPQPMNVPSRHVLAGSFFISHIDPAVEFGQMTSVISRMAGLSRLGNAVVAGKTPQWVMSARGRGHYLEMSAFAPTSSLRVCSQQIHRMVAACVMLVMQLQHPAKGA